MLTRPITQTVPYLLAGALVACCLAIPAAAADDVRQITVFPTQPTSEDSLEIRIQTYCCQGPVTLPGLGVLVLPGLIRITADRICGPLAAITPYEQTVTIPPVDPGDYWIEYRVEGDDCSHTGPEVVGQVTVLPAGNGPSNPAPPFDTWITSPETPGFRFQVQITAGDLAFEGRQELDCQSETVCVSGAIPGRPEAFLRILGPRANGYYWPTIIRFTPSQVEAWIEELATGTLRYYRLNPVPPGTNALPGLQDRTGFEAP